MAKEMRSLKNTSRKRPGRKKTSVPYGYKATSKEGIYTSGPARGVTLPRKLKATKSKKRTASAVQKNLSRRKKK